MEYNVNTPQFEEKERMIFFVFVIKFYTAKRCISKGMYCNLNMKAPTRIFSFTFMEMTNIHKMDIE